MIQKNCTIIGTAKRWLRLHLYCNLLHPVGGWKDCNLSRRKLWIFLSDKTVNTLCFIFAFFTIDFSLYRCRCHKINTVIWNVIVLHITYLTIIYVSVFFFTSFCECLNGHNLLSHDWPSLQMFEVMCTQVLQMDMLSCCWNNDRGDHLCCCVFSCVFEVSILLHCISIKSFCYYAILILVQCSTSFFQHFSNHYSE